MILALRRSLFLVELWMKTVDNYICTLAVLIRTSDFRVDNLQTWWNGLPGDEQHLTQLIQLKIDNGPESSGIRTQFLKRMVDSADEIGKPLQLL